MHCQKKCLCVLLNVIVATCAREPSSPACSRYDYEERLLERVLRNELALETTLNEILKTNAKVVDALKQLEDGKAKVESMLTVIEKKEHARESRLAEYITNSSHVMNSTLAETKTDASVTVQQLVNEVRVLKDQLKVPTIYFLARMTSTQTAVSSGQDVVFPMMEVNEGRGYDNSTGKFTASVSGMYLFSVQYCAPHKKEIYLEIVHQGKTLQKTYHYDTAGHTSCMTTQASAVVAMGHQVWVRAGGSTTLYTDSHRYTSFSGTLIHV